MEEILQSKWVMGYYGWMLYNVALAIYQQSKFDTDNNGYGFSEICAFLKFNNVSIIFTLMLVPIVESQAQNILILYNHVMGTEYPFIQFYYYFVGILAVFIQIVIHKFSKIKIS